MDKLMIALFVLFFVGLLVFTNMNRSTKTDWKEEYDYLKDQYDELYDNTQEAYSYLNGALNYYDMDEELYGLIYAAMEELK